MKDFLYELKRCIPMITFYVLGIIGMLWFMQNQAYAKGTIIQECSWCGHINLDLSPTCPACGEKDFRTVYVHKEDETAPKKNKRKRKCIEYEGREKSM